MFRKAPSVGAEGGEAGFGGAEFPGLVSDEEVDLGGKGGSVGRWGAEQVDKGAIVAGAGAGVDIVVRSSGQGGEFGVGLGSGQGRGPIK
jgi:hypothetical protein